jgi:hypothetical protein
VGESKCRAAPPKSKSVLESRRGYKKNCASGFTKGRWQAHHILCDVSVRSRKFPEKVASYAEDCLREMDWNINDASNLIGLPLNVQYRLSSGKVPKDLCSHQIDHNTKNGYTAECTKWLQRNVWRTLEDTRKKHDHKPEDVAALLRQGTALFRSKLDVRGRREGGTQRCWEHRFKTDPEHIKRWYAPFSMAQDPLERSPGRSQKLKVFTLIR